MTDKKYDLDDLNWIRLFNPMLIPKYLVEQVRDRDFSVDDFFKYQDINCLMKGNVLNPFNHLYALVDPENIIKGYLWFVIDSLSKDVVINTYSVDKAYWFKGKAVEKLSNHVKEIMKKLKLKKTYWLTNYPKHSERHGFKRSRSVLMEYMEVPDGKNNDGGSVSRGECEHVDTRTTAVI